ncbi:LacI family DNA-binding transcriptional regulator [Rhizobium terrae]|uniref:LacI family DNA-binding transcriptional regulator n=1 Tax=Rhizobium terrae TaxID=2171756 RepID=UPI000E3C4BBE|nr:LacI family DNA-binding transcriptional regulator [Rhizobium terrae]
MSKRRTDGRPTIADVATRAGVGAITVSRALRDPSLVSDALRQKISTAVRELGYVPNLNARALASTRSDVVGVLVPSLTQHIFADVLRGIYDGIGTTRLHIQVGNTRYDLDEEDRLLAELLRYKPAGLIVSGIDQSPAGRRMLEKANCPVIQIMDLSDDPVNKIIGFSHHNAAKAMTQHLIEAGYRRIGFLSGWMNSRSKGRLSGYAEALDEAGFFDPALTNAAGDLGALALRGSWDKHQYSTPAMGRELLSELWRRAPDMDAVFCNNDVLALGALFECHARGVSVPRDFGIAGFNDEDFMEAASPALSSVRTHRWKVGHDAVVALRRQLDGEPDDERVVDVGFDIVKRASTDRRGLGAGEGVVELVASQPAAIGSGRMA